MDWHKFTKMCLVWHMDRFWHIHIPAPDPYNGNPGITEHAFRVSKCTKLPIRWTFSTGYVIWTTDGVIASPFEPASYSTAKDGKPNLHMRWNGYDPKSGLIDSNMNPRTGSYNNTWIDTGPNDQPSYSLIFDAKSAQWSSIMDEKTGHSEGLFLEHHDLFPKADIVFSVARKERAWCMTDDRIASRLYGPENVRRRYSRLIEMGVYERGYVQDSGVPMLIRFSRKQEYQWLDPEKSYTINNGTGMLNLHRVDGPARVDLPSVVTRIIGDSTTVHLSSLPHHHHWRMSGINLPPAKMAEVIEQNGMIVRDGPLHDHSAFPRADDLMIWSMTKW